MKKAFTKKKDINDFKTAYTKSEFKSEVISNLLTHNPSNKKVKMFSKFMSKRNHYKLYFLVSMLANDATNERFGKYDFKFSGNRDYKLTVLNHNDLLFVVPNGREVIVPEKIDSAFLDNVVDFEKEFMTMCIDYAINNKENIPYFYKENLDYLISKNIVKDGKIEFGF